MRLALPSPAAPTAQIRIDTFPLQVAAFCVLWSSAFAVAKVGLADSPPLLFLMARFLLAGAIMLGAAAVMGLPWQLERRDLAALGVLGVANNAVYLGLNYVGMGSVSAGLAALIISANPVLTALLAAMVLGERMTWRKAAGLVLGVAGVAYVVQSRISGGIESLTGVAFVIGALVSLVLGTILFKRLSPNGGLWLGNGVQNLAGGLALVPFAFALENVGDVTPTWHLVASLLYLVVLGSVFAYLLWFRLLTVSGATAASAYHFLMPPLGMLFGWLLLGEHVQLSDMIGIVPVAFGIYLVTRPGKAA